MPTSDEGAVVEIVREGDVLRFRGTLWRARLARAWRRLPPLAGVRTIDIAAVDAIDSAGLALLAEVAARCGGAAIAGAPAGFAELRSAYRLDAGLGFGTD